MTTLTCACGRRLNVRGMAPGRSGVCPACGGPVRVPGGPAPTPRPPAPAPVVEDEWDWEGDYAVDEAEPPAAAAPAPDPDPAPAPQGGGAYHVAELVASPPRAARTPPPVVARREVVDAEPWFPPRLLFPARGLEGGAMVVALGLAFWVAATLVPEYCLGVLADAAKLGATPMGYLVMLITATPVILLSPLALVYWLQYLARVLIGASQGERQPPRPPDRNADGLLGGMASWAGWLFLGLGVGLAPLGVGYAAGVGHPGGLAALGLVGLPYATMALLLSFLHDEDLAARPGRVLGGFARVGPSFLGVCLVVAGLLGAAGAAFWGAFALRDGHFAAYIVACLGCWMGLAWATIVAMHTLGSYQSARRGRLRWRRPRAWWETG